MFGVVLVPGTPAEAATTTAVPGQMTVVNGVLGLAADVRVDGRLVLSGFAPMRVTDPLPMSAGAHRFQIWGAGAAMSSKPVLDKIIPVEAGAHGTLSVGLDARGTSQLTIFDDDLTESRGGATAIAVRDIAAAPPVRVTVDSTVLAADIQAPQQKASKITPGSHAVAVLPASGTSPLVPSQSVPTVAGRATVVYLIGSAQDGSLGLISQMLRPTADAPQAMQTGVGPPLHRGPGRGLIALTGMAVLAVATSFARVRRWRSASTTAG